MSAALDQVGIIVGFWFGRYEPVCHAVRAMPLLRLLSSRPHPRAMPSVLHPSEACRCFDVYVHGGGVVLYHV